MRNNQLLSLLLGARPFNKEALGQSGFTLVEVLVSTVILGALIVVITSLFLTVDSTQLKAQRLESASRAGELKLESLRNQHYNSLETGEVIDFADELPGNIPEPRTATVTVSEPEDDMKRLEIEITYQDGAKTREVNLSALIGSIGIAQ